MTWYRGITWDTVFNLTSHPSCLTPALATSVGLGVNGESFARSRMPGGRVLGFRVCPGVPLRNSPGARSCSTPGYRLALLRNSVARTGLLHRVVNAGRAILVGPVGGGTWDTRMTWYRGKTWDVVLPYSLRLTPYSCSCDLGEVGC